MGNSVLILQPKWVTRGTDCVSESNGTRAQAGFNVLPKHA